MSYNASYWFARGYFDGRATGMESNDIPEDYHFSYNSGFQAGIEDYTELDSDSYDGQPDEAQEWHDFDPDC
jgi:hypothetical protein